MKKIYLIVIAAILVIGFLVFEDKKETEELDESTVENALDTGEVDYMQERQKATIQALELYQEKRQEGMRFSSQCLGTVGGSVKYAVDIVHVPRSSEDNEPENQCRDYREGKVEHFIELDKDGSIVRIE